MRDASRQTIGYLRGVAFSFMHVARDGLGSRAASPASRSGVVTHAWTRHMRHAARVLSQLDDF